MTSTKLQASPTAIYRRSNGPTHHLRYRYPNTPTRCAICTRADYWWTNMSQWVESGIVPWSILYDYVYVEHFPLLIHIFQTTSLKYSLMEVWTWEAWIWEVWGECLEVRQQTNKTKVLLVYQGYPFFSK